ncbi:MAG: beta-lactamase family protein [Oscillospiraceae bacterium]|nr:beta-lactamase family protein [Oscillospiraceae bacterium]
MSEFKHLDELFQKFVDDGLPGCSCVIAKKGEILYENYFGYSDIENKVPLTENNLFRQASLTKIAMYTTAMMLYEQGKFLMTDPIYEYFPEWKNSTKTITLPNGKVEVVPVDHPITVKNIMNMTCGLPYQMIMGNIPVAHPTSRAMARAMKDLTDKGHYTLREQIKAISTVPLAFEPGTRWLYGFASELTAGLLEVIGGKAAELVIKENLFDALGMDDSANFLNDRITEDRLVKGYYLVRGKKLGDEGALVVSPPDREASMVGKLGEVSGFQRVITNSKDYTKLMQMLANGGVYNGERIMGRKTIDLMRTNTISDKLIKEDFSNTYLAGYGYGYGVRTLMDKYVGHHNGSLGQFGWTGGSGTWAEADPSEGTSIVYMHNVQPNHEEYHHIRMRDVAYGCLE